MKNGDNITATFTSADPSSPVGTYPIVPVLNDPAAKLGNYTVTITGGTLTITPAPLTVTAVGGSRVYGDANPAATITGLKNGDNITVTYSTPTAASPVGNYTLNPILVDPTGKLGNYTVTTKTAALTINKAPLSVTANMWPVIMAPPNPAFTGTISGIKNATTSRRTRPPRPRPARTPVPQ